MRILLAAPRVPDLPWAETEVMAVERMPGLEVTLRLGNVTPADLLHDVITGEYDGFWFAGHATALGLLLSNGPLPNAEIVPLLRGRFEWAFLNTCESDTTARLIRRETGMAVVATITEVPDQLAYQTGVLFAEVLGRTGDLAAAYEQSRPMNRVYVYEAGTVKKKCRRITRPSNAIWSAYCA